MTSESASFSRRQAVYFSLLGGVSYFAYIPAVQIGAFSVSVVATRYGFDLAALGTILAIVTIGDAIWDTLIGTATDRYKSRWGWRRPWIAVGVPLTLVTGLLLYFPRQNLTIWSFAFCFAAFNLAASLFQVPYFAWATAATRDGASRNRLYFVIPIVAWIATAIAFLIPLLPIFETNELTLEVICVSLVIFAFLAPPAMYLLFRHIPETAPVARSRPRRKAWLLDVWTLLRRNPPFRFLVLINVVGGMGASASAGLFFFWFDSYLGLGGYFSAIGIATLIPGILAPVAGSWLARRFSRNVIFVWSSLAQASSGVVMLMLTPDTPGLVPIFLIVTALFSGGIGTLLVIITRAFYADIADYGRLMVGLEGGGLYVSAASVVNKVQLTVFGSMGLVIVGLFGFQPGAESHSEQAIWALRITVAGFPVIFSSVAALMMRKFPLDEERMRIISSRLAMLEERYRRGGGKGL